MKNIFYKSLLVGFLGQFLNATTVFAEDKTNVTLAGVPSITAGPTEINGDLTDGQQDIWLFKVDPTDALLLYAVQVEGMADTGGIVGIINIERDAEQQVTRRTDIALAGVRPNLASESLITRITPQFLSAGEYVVGVTPLLGGVGDYQLRFTALPTTPIAADATALEKGLWQGRGFDGEQCYSLPEEAVDVSVWARKGEDVTVALKSADGVGHLRAGAGPMWEASSISAGPNQLCLSASANIPWIAQVSATAIHAFSHEPDDTASMAHPLSTEGRISAQIDARGSGRDTDTFLLSADTNAHVLRVTASDGANLYYELHAAGTRIKYGSVGGEIAIHPFVATQDLTLSITGEIGAQYEISYTPVPSPQSHEETEPNDTIATANLWTTQTPATGLLGADDSDYHYFDIDGPAQLWRLQVDGAAITYLTVYDVADAVIAARRGNNAALQRISNLYMIPGRYKVKVEGEGAYNLRLIPQGPRRDDVEMEPNDDAQLLAIGQSLRGQLDPFDQDHFRFSLRASEWLTLQITPPLGETISVYMLAEGGEVFRKGLTGGQSKLDYTRVYHAGEYEIQIETAGGISGLDDYTIALRPAEQPFGPLIDREPNDYAYAAENWPEDGRLVGRVGVVGQDRDAYLLPVITHGADLRFCGLSNEISISVYHPDGTEVRHPAIEKTDAGECLIFDDLTTGDHIIFVEQNSAGARTGNPTDYVIAPLGQAAGEQGGAPLPLTQLDIVMVETPPAPRAFVEGFAQHLPLGFTVTGYDAMAPLSVTMSASEPNWALGPLDITDQGDGRALVKTELIVPPDIGTAEIRVHLKLENAAGRGVISQTFMPSTQGPAQSPQRAYLVPDALLGGLNMAAATFGGRIAALDGSDLAGRDPENGRGANALIDGLAIASHAFDFRHVEHGAVFNFDLGGDDPVPLAGLLLTPRVAPGASRTLKDFIIEASEDGETFDQVLRATLLADPVEQGFVFDQVIQARALRLVPLSSWTTASQDEIPVRLGEFKAVAVAGWTPNPTTPVNIADMTFGGQVVWADPAGQIDTDWDRGLLLDGDTRPSVIRNVNKLPAVIGFHHSRVARISAIDWVMDTVAMTTTNTGDTDKIMISASLDGPLGPWVEVAQWVSDAENRMGVEFVEPIWARYLRFDMSTTATAEYLRIPEQIRVYEAAPTVAFPSILGEWGEFSQASAYERATAVTPIEPPAPTGGATAALAVPLAPDMPVSSSVHRGGNVDWWRVTAPFGVGELRVTLDTNLQGGARPALFDIGGTAVPIRRATLAEAEARGLPMPLYLAAVSENQPYDLQIEEPLRPIMIVWDTSGSTAPYKPAMDRALGDIALQADPDRDLIGFLPFGGSVLGDTLLGDPELLIRKLGHEAPSGDSSNAEAALVQANAALKDQDGVRGIILITDAATNRDSALWQSLRNVRPRIGALALPSTGAFGPNPDRERDLMENWARANGGFYQYISTQSDFTEGFARAVDKMRGPKPYQITISYGPFVPQPDGSLRVIETRAEGGSDQAITSSLLVLMDTSGSMLQRIDGKRRYQVAQEALAPLATQAAERGIAIGVRQFGIEPDACDTGLLAPIASRSPREMTDILAKILPKNNARTPIAAALIAAGEDLANAQGVPRIVILTDGEETCNGDPEAVIKDLAAQGIAVRIDIVGFAIDDPALSASFADWARAGGGVYVNADDREALESALLDVSQTQFRALSDTGFEVAGIVGGDAIVLPAGRYTLILEGRDDPQEIEILSDTESVIDLNK